MDDIPNYDTTYTKPKRAVTQPSYLQDYILNIDEDDCDRIVHDKLHNAKVEELTKLKNYDTYEEVEYKGQV